MSHYDDYIVQRADGYKYLGVRDFVSMQYALKHALEASNNSNGVLLALDKSPATAAAFDDFMR